MSKTHQIQEYSVQEGKNIQLGQGGYVHLKTTSSEIVHTDEGHYNAITVLEDECTVTVVDVAVHGEIGKFFLLKPVPAGTTLYGAWTRVSIKRTGSNNTSAIVYKG